MALPMNNGSFFVVRPSDDGADVLDGGEPAYFADYLVTVRFSLDYWSEDARLAFLDWCESGELPAEPLNGQAIWPSVVRASV